MNLSDELLEKYVDHVLRWEGRTSKDPVDTQAKCAPFPGAFHTNKGVTFCTFKKAAEGLGIIPVTYERFLKLDELDIKKFILHFAIAADADELDTRVCLSITEAAWGSGPNRAIKHLQAALNLMGDGLKVDGDMGPSTKKAAMAADPAKLYSAYWKQRQAFIDMLVANPKWSKYKNGWNNRIQSFFQIFGQP